MVPRVGLDQKPDRSQGYEVRAMKTPPPAPPPHPGKILEFEMKQTGIDVNKLAAALSVPAASVAQILNGDRDITPEMAMRLDRCLGVPADEWLQLQNAFGLARVAQEMIEREVVRLVRPRHGREKAKRAAAAKGE